jgi:hypothetical protein
MHPSHARACDVRGFWARECATLLRRLFTLPRSTASMYSYYLRYELLLMQRLATGHKRKLPHMKVAMLSEQSACRNSINKFIRGDATSIEGDL